MYLFKYRHAPDMLNICCYAEGAKILLIEELEGLTSYSSIIIRPGQLQPKYFLGFR